MGRNGLRRSAIVVVTTTSFLLVTATLFVATCPAASAAPADASPAQVEAGQMITVDAPTPDSTTGTLTAWSRGGDGGWRAAIGPVQAYVGRAGIGRASEGSGRTPAGIYALTQAFGTLTDPGTRLPYFQTDPSDWWDGNPSSPTYNQHVRRAASPGGDSENLYYAGSVYDYAVNMDYNIAGVPGAGSAFFLHVTDGRPTAGCIAVPQATMASILEWLDPARHPFIYIEVGAAWKPPAPQGVVSEVDSLAAIWSGEAIVPDWARDPTGTDPGMGRAVGRSANLARVS